MNFLQIEQHLLLLKNEKKANFQQRFFKTGIGHYSAHDQFLGISTPELRLKVKEFGDALTLKDLEKLLHSPFNDIRLFSLLNLVKRYQDKKTQQEVVEIYFKNKKQVNNWNLVDSSAHQILGAHLLQKNKNERKILYELSLSSSLWDRRIAIVSTYAFIKAEVFDNTLKICKILMNDEEDLIHKATGWMLREVGKKNKEVLVQFLNTYKTQLKRTTLRYAIERFDKKERKKFLGP